MCLQKCAKEQCPNIPTLSREFVLRSGKVTDLSTTYSKTDATLNKITWKKFGDEKVFETKLRFQIKLDDFR